MVFPRIDFPVQAWLMTSNCVGMLMGPSLGAVLFEIGGFKLPVISASIATLIVSIGLFFVTPKDGMLSHAYEMSINQETKSL